MQALRFLFSPSGRLSPQSFAIAAIAVYAAFAASQLLTAPDVVARGGLRLFAAAQIALTWIWFALHARRLHDAGRAEGIAAGAALLYGLSVVLFLIMATAFFTSLGALSATNGSGAIGIALMVSLLALLSNSGPHDLGWFVVAILMALAFAPILVALAVTLWAATRPRIGT